MKLTDDQIAFYHDQGYLKMDSLCAEQEVAWVRKVYDNLFAQSVGRDTGDQFDLAGTDTDSNPARLPQLMNPQQYALELLDAEFRQAALALAQQLLGDEAVADAEHAIFKPATDGAETPWHQDQAYWDPEYDYEGLSVWMPLQEATVANGCLQFIPGTHRQDVQPHHSIGHDPRVHGLEMDVDDTSEAVTCPLPAGGCTIHHCRTFHYAAANQSTIPRRAYILTFRLPPEKRTVPHEFPWLAERQTAREKRAAQLKVVAHDERGKTS